MDLNYRPVELLEQGHRETRSEHVESSQLVVLQGLEGMRRVWFRVGQRGASVSHQVRYHEVLDLHALASVYSRDVLMSRRLGIPGSCKLRSCNQHSTP
jgi:hypothetical protein